MRSALALARELGLRPEEAHGLRTLGRIQSAEGRNDDASDNIAFARSIYQDLKMEHWLRQ